MLGAVQLHYPEPADAGYVPVDRPTVVAGDDSIRTPSSAGLLTSDGETAARAPGLAPPPRASAPPVRLELPGLGLTASVIPVVVAAGGALAVPDDPAVVGWWAGGALPGGGQGSVIIDGHVDSYRQGLGAFARLVELAPGDLVLVTGATGETRRYRMTGRRQFPKAELPAANVFAQEVQERLVLITCGGTFDSVRRRYADNVVVFAVPEEDGGAG